jgi:hypothetical protein
MMLVITDGSVSHLTLCVTHSSEWEKALQLLGVIGIGQVSFSISTINLSV